MSPPTTAPFRAYADSYGFDPEWLLAHARKHLGNAPANIDASFEWTTEFNEMLLALGRRAVSAIHLANFKAFGPSLQRFPLAPITLLFGPNSAGKSSLLHALLYAKHTVSEDTLFARHPKGAGTLVDLGKFNDMVHGHDATAVMQFGFEFNHLQRKAGPDSPPTIWWIALRNDAVVSATLEMNGSELLHFAPSPDNRASLRCIRADTSAPFFQQLAEKNLPIDGSLKPWSEWPESERRAISEIFERCVRGGRLKLRGLLPSDLTFANARLSVSDLIAPNVVHSDEGSNADGSQPDWIGEATSGPVFRVCEKGLTQLIRQVFEQAEYFLRCLGYLSPVRVQPGREFENIQKTDSNHWHNGGASWLMLAEDQEVRARINRWFEELQQGPPRGIAFYRFDSENDLNQISVESVVERIANDYLMEKFQEHEKDRGRTDDPDANERFHFPFDQLDAADITQRVRDALAKDKQAITGRRLIIRDARIGSKPRVTPAEIGIGIQHLIPVLVESLFGGNQHLLIEEPELHAHPAMQAELGDVFIEGACAAHRASWRRHFIVETHSEHLILRLLRRIRETTAGNRPENLPPVYAEDVSVLFVSPTKEGSRIIHLAVDETGRFTSEWPGGFFAERLDEVF